MAGIKLLVYREGQYHVIGLQISKRPISNILLNFFLGFSFSLLGPSAFAGEFQRCQAEPWSHGVWIY